MGRDKAEIVVPNGETGGETLLARTVRVSLEVAGECVVVLAPEQRSMGLDARTRVVRDPAPHEGPIVAIAHAVDAVRAPWVLVLATDHPHLSSAVLRRLATLVNVDGASVDGEPFLAVYRTVALRDATRQMVQEGERRARALSARMSLRKVVADDLLADPEVRHQDPTLRSLCDVDTPEELDAVGREGISRT